MLRLLIIEKVGWLTKDWQTGGAIITIFKKGDRKGCMICREICLTKIVEFKLEDGQCSFCPGRSTTYLRNPSSKLKMYLHSLLM